MSFFIFILLFLHFTGLNLFSPFKNVYIWKLLSSTIIFISKTIYSFFGIALIILGSLSDSIINKYPGNFNWRIKEISFENLILIKLDSPSFLSVSGILKFNISDMQYPKPKVLLVKSKLNLLFPLRQK